MKTLETKCRVIINKANEENITPKSFLGLKEIISFSFIYPTVSRLYEAKKKMGAK